MPETTTYHNALRAGSMLLEYRLESVLGAGGFGMTYLGWDINLEKHVAIKEYLPTDLAVRALDGSVVPITTEFKYNYQWGLERFIMEARTLAKFSHPHIVRVNRYFEANGTGYMVMDYEKGESLNQILRRSGPPDEGRLKAILMPLLDGLQAVHATGFLHRDIKPANIFVRENSSPVLIDFGASRQAVGGATKSVTAVLTPGYAPLEQYSTDGNQGPWTDIYAMAGVIYRVLANDNPPDAVSRLKADTVPGKLLALRGRVSEPLLRSLEWALAVDEKQRPQSIPEWTRALEGVSPAPAASRMSVQSAPTLRPGAMATAQIQRSLPAYDSRRVTLPPTEEPGPRRRWWGILAALLLAVAVYSILDKHKSAKEREQEEAAKLSAERAAEIRKDLEQSAAERRRAEEEMRRLTTPPSGPILMDPQLPGETIVPRPPSPAAAAGEPPSPAPPLRDRPGRERDERPGSPENAKEKFQRFAEQDFRAADLNGDGYLTPDEVHGRYPLLEREFRRVDSDGDGRVSQQEFSQFRRMQAESFLRKK